MLKYPLFIHVGLMKTGTTSIQDQLLKDDRINLILKAKYFNSHLYHLKEYDFLKEDKVNIESDEQLLTNNNFYAGSETVLKRIKESTTNSKIICTIREQRSLLISAFKHTIRFTNNYYSSMEDFLYSKEGNIFLYMCDLNCIYNQINTYVPKENIHFLLFEDLKSNYKDFYKNLYDLLGLQLPDLKENLKSNEGWPDILILIKLWINKLSVFKEGRRIVSLENYEYNARTEFKFFSFSGKLLVYIFTKVISLFFRLFPKLGKKKINKFQWGNSDLFIKLDEHFNESNEQFHKLTGVEIYKYNYL